MAAWRLWTVLLAGPLAFLAAIVVLSVWLGARGVPTGRSGAEATAHAPHLLVGVLAILGLIAWRLPLRELWAWPRPQRAGLDA